MNDAFKSITNGMQSNLSVSQLEEMRQRRRPVALEGGTLTDTV